MADSDFVKPVDVPDYVPQTVTWAANGNPTYAAAGNSAPGYAYEFEDPNPTDPDGWVVIGDYSANNGTNGFKTQAQGASEAKMRTHINASHVLSDDPIRAYGQPGTSHVHTFLGNKNINAWTTYRSGRNHPESVAAGGPLNGTGYWIPSWLVPLGGKTYAKLPDFSVVYYVASMAEASLNAISRLPFGIRYVTGWNMDDHLESLVYSELTAAGGYNTTSINNGFKGWKMVHYATSETLMTDNGTYLTKHIVNDDGSDPWEGEADSNYRLVGVLNAPEYWDGVNFWSPGGYKHFRHAQHHTDSGKKVGPNNFVRVPTLEITFYYTHGGWNDYKTWRLSSDDHLLHLGIGDAMLPGSTFHTDWIGLWDQEMMKTWQRNGQGVDGFTPHEMNDSVMSATQKLITNTTAPDGRNPQVNLSLRLTTTPENMILIPDVQARGPFTTKGRAS